MKITMYQLQNVIKMAMRFNKEKKMKRKFYAFEYTDGFNTTTGEPNTDTGKFNGRLSIAGYGKVFLSKKERDAWVLNARNKKRQAVTKRELRYLYKGAEKRYFDEELAILSDLAEELAEEEE